jgi:hypothetical protein
MKYQLVLQFPVLRPNEFDSFLAIEELLAEELVDGSEVDGHDVGPNEFNIFIFTDNPLSTFKQVQEIIAQNKFWERIRAAYREADGTAYSIIWPKGLGEFKVT